MTQGLHVGEGIETTLAGMQMGLRPAWSLASTTGVANFPILPGVESLTIFQENDANGASAKAVEACANRWRGLGCEVIVSDPLLGSDLTDVVRGRAS